ncbi:sensor histidine kinase [Slackia heliotrinireducens]|uniref:sensor histidine kinase n=1 Tax=Slackia heliotrinireducens TaxID=84110 RepID=UPI003315ED9D
MLKKLRTKFVAYTMAMVSAVVIVTFAGIAAYSYQNEMNSLDMALEHAVSDDRAVGGKDGMAGPRSDDTQAPFADGNMDEAPDGQMAGPQIGGGAGREQLIPVAVYLQAEDGSLSSQPGLATALISDEVLASVSPDILDAADGKGYLSDAGLYYLKRTTDSGIYVAFADESSVSNWKSLALALVFAGVGVLALFFGVSIFLSRWALRPVEEAWTAQKQFVADASHELKTPLTVILANASILLKHPERSIAQESQWIESTQVEAEHMQDLVSDMLTLAQVESASRPEHSDVDFSTLVDGISMQFDSVAYENGVYLDTQVEEGIHVNGNVKTLDKLVATLIENACKYAGTGGSIDVKLFRTSHQIRLDVHNTGNPIHPEDLAHIFDRFYRADKARTHEDSSFGLGLAIARSIAEEHGGTIEATSSEAEGTTFSVTLPAM